MLKRREEAICKCCGQRILVRHGVQLSPRLADIFDMVERAGKNGIATEVLASVFYPTTSYLDGRQALRANIWHLNARLASTGIEVRGEAGFYRIIRRRKP